MIETSKTVEIERIPIKTDGRIVLVPVRAIQWLESAGNYVEIFWGKQSEKLTVRNTLSSFEERLNGQAFIRIHRSIIVNAGHVHRRIRVDPRQRQTADHEPRL
jgi:two-component system LytT family response regulator